MPGMDSILGAVAGGSNIFDVGINALLQQKANKDARRYATYMYDRQRADAVEDWNKQNAYNAPSAQMERLKAAKLNPNLVYGTGVQAAGLSTPVRASSAQGWKPEAPQVSIGSAVSGYLDTKMKQTQMDTMRSVQEVNEERKRQIVMDTILKGKQGGLVDTTNAARAFKLGLDKSLVGITVDTASAKLDLIKSQKDKVVTDTFMTMHEDIRRTLLSSATFQEKMQHVALMVAQEAAVKQGIKLSQAQVEKINAEVDVLGTTQLGKDLDNRLKSSTLDYQTMQRIQDWFKNTIGKLL